MIKPYYTDPQSEIYYGDAQEIMLQLPEHSVDMVMTSPPYFGLRKYKAPDKVFDNHNGCKHEWTDLPKLHDCGIHNGNNDRPGHPFGAKGNIQAARERTGGGFFCSKCGAWRGQLGLEPTPELYIKHLCDILDACKHVLKKTGTLWVNIDDS
jgi:DNA modification methylase